MYSSYLRASIGGIGSGNSGYPQPPTLPAGTAYRPPIPGIVPLTIDIQPKYSTILTTYSTFISTITYPSTFVSTINYPSTFVSSLSYFTGYVSTPTNFVALGNPYKSLSESARVQAQQCTTMYISNMPVPVQRGDSNNIPFIEVIPTPASATTASVQNAVLFAQNNPYNPATRFSQYRFADTVIPPGVPCPPKPAPNPAPLIPCVPPLVFRGSVENVGPI